MKIEKYTKETRYRLDLSEEELRLIKIAFNEWDLVRSYCGGGYLFGVDICEFLKTLEQ